MTKEPEQIGRYAVTSELGRGSMGVVHLAHDPLMDRDLAIKTILLPCGLTRERKEEFRARFLREAQAAGKLSHPGIVTIYDFNQQPGVEPPFIAMEYVEGPTLHELICNEGALAPEWALSMAETLADALRVAHESGVLHRDMKPANILVRESDGVAKIADFGVAQVRATEGGGSDYTYGSPSYMAPESVRGEPTDERSDLFSLAVILYETLCGQRPFDGDGYDAIRHAIVHDPPIPIRLHSQDLSPAFEHFFQRALAKSPDERYQGAAEFCAAIQEIREEQLAFGEGAQTVIAPVPPEVAEFEAGEASVGSNLRMWVWIGAVALLVAVAFTLGRGVGTPEAAAQPDPGPAPSVARTAQVEPEPVLPPSSAAPVDTVFTSPVEPTPVEPVPFVVEPPAERPAPAPVAKTPAPKPVPAPVAKKTTPPVIAKPAPVEEPAPEPVEPPAEIAPAHVVVETARIDLQVSSNLKSGTLTLLVDGDEVYYTELSSGESHKMSRVFKKAVGRSTQELTTTLDLPAGAHTVTARVFNEAKSRELTEELEIELEPDVSRSLRIVTGGTFGRRLDLETY